MHDALTRRQFLESSAVAASAILGAPLFLHATDKAGTKRPVVGSGDYTFECDHDWGKRFLPDGHGYGGASHGVAIDSQGRIYISHQGNPGSIFVFDDHGQFIKSMGEQLVIDGTGKGHGIDIRQEGNEEFIYLSPNQGSLGFTKLTLDGELVWMKGREAIHKDSGVLTEGVNFIPTNTSFRPDGGYYLGDGYGSYYVFEYDKDDKFVRVIGGPGTDAGKFRTPHGNWLDERDGVPKLVVADRANHRLQWFDLDGNYLKSGDGTLYPSGIDIRGDIMLIADLHSRITLLDKDNNVVTHLGDDDDWRAKVLNRKLGMRTKPELSQPGKFMHPHDACFDQHGNIYCPEWIVSGRVTKLVRV